MSRLDGFSEPTPMVFLGPLGMVIAFVVNGAVAFWVGGLSAVALALGMMVMGMTLGWFLLGHTLNADGWVIATLKNAQGKRRYIVGKEVKPEPVEQPKAVVRWL